MQFHIITLGCKINQYESQAIIESLHRRGYEHVLELEKAWTIIINSCAVTSRAVRDMKKICRRAARSNPQAKLIITGCAAQVMEKELALMSEVHQVIPQKDKPSLLNGLEPRPRFRSDINDYSISDYFRARAVVKVQDGCSHGCSYCIVPLARGKSQSRPPETILQEINRLLNKGFSEITLGGINLRLYGRDISPGIDFWGLIRFLQCNLPSCPSQPFRIRLSSIEPSELSPRALETLSGWDRLCPHLHISLQSGSMSILEKMNRGHYNPFDLIDFSKNMKKIWPLYSMGADILVGFPGETRKDFEQTMELIRKIPLSYAHIFPFSPRPGTSAWSMGGRIGDNEIKARKKSLSTLVSQKRAAFLQRLVREKYLNMVMETETKGMSEHYVECRICSRSSFRPRQMIRARPLGVREQTILVEPVNNPVS